MSITDEDYAYLLTRNRDASKALRELIAEARRIETALMDALAAAADKARG